MIYRIGLLLFLMVSMPTYAYWNCDYRYRTEVLVVEESGQNLSDYQVNISISANSFNGDYVWSSNGDDLRVVDQDDATQIDYWIESWDANSQTASIWLRFDQLSANERRTIYLYYGNPLAESDASAEFTFTQPGIKFHTKQNTVNPASRSEVQTLFELSSNDINGYGCGYINNFNNVRNQIINGAASNFIAYSETFFHVEDGEQGSWNIRYGSDFGYGGGLYINGQTIDEDWNTDLWWNNNWNNSDVLQGTVQLPSGYHRLEVIGAEDCCDGGISVQFQKPGSGWQTYNTNNIDIRSRSCPIAEPTIQIVDQAIADCEPININNCTATFPDGLGTTANNGRIDFGFNAQIVNNPDNLLSARTVNTNAGSSQLSCTDAHCEGGDTQINSVGPGNFQRRNSNQDIDVGFLGNQAIGLNDRYDDISTGFLATLNITNQFHQVFFIDSLDIGSLSTVNLEAGTYWINDLSMAFNSEINIISGPVRIYVNRDLDIGSSARINAQNIDTPNDPRNLLLYLYRDLNTDSDVAISGAVYSDRDINLGFNNRLYGMATARNIGVGGDTQVLYDASIYSGLRDISWCENTIADSGIINIQSPASAVNCTPSENLITISDATGNILTGYQGSIELTTSSGKGDWILSDSAFGTLENGVINDGRAIYNMNESDNGQVILLLRHTTAQSVGITASNVATQSNSTTQFNESGFIFSDISPQIAGLGSSGHVLQAVQSNTQTGACEALLLDTQFIEIAAQCIQPEKCSDRSVSINGTTAAMNDQSSLTLFSPIGFDFLGSDSNQAEFSYEYSDAGLIQLHARFNLRDENSQLTGDTIEGSSGFISNRPDGFCISFPEQNAECSVPGLGDDCSAFKQAGSFFTADVTAKVYSASLPICDRSTTPNFNHIVNLQHTLVAPSVADGGEAGSLNTASINFSSGIYSGLLQLSEMGVFKLQVGGNSYLQSILPSTVSENIGRFYPKSFFITGATLVDYSNGNTGFTYTGQRTLDETEGAINYITPPRIRFVARGRLDQPLNNYRAPLASNINFNIRAQALTLGVDGNPLQTSAEFFTGSITGPNNNTEFTYQLNSADHFTFIKNENSMVAPFNHQMALDVLAITNDIDGVALENGPYRLTGNGGNIRYGRLKGINAYGVETRPIEQVWQAEYYDGDRFILNTLDSGTTMNTSNITDITVLNEGNTSNPLLVTSSTVESRSGALLSGVIGFNWSATTNGEYGRYGYTYQAPSWLQFDWLDNGTEQNPKAEVTFGQYRGHDRIIYWKELTY